MPQAEPDAPPAAPARPVVVLMCGLAFSGKTRLARAIAAELRADYVGLDEINAARGLHGGDGMPVEAWEETHRLAHERIAAAVTSSRSVVVDDTICFRWLRDRYREAAARLGADAVVVFVDTPRTEIERRRARNDETGERRGIAAEVFARHAAEFERPADDEPVLVFRPGDDAARWLRLNLGDGS